jgi:hypothetical protein
MSLLAGIDDAESALRLWLHLRAGGDQLRALDLYDSKEVCARCGKGPQTFQGSLRNRLAVCMACRQPWRGMMVPVLQPRVPAPKPDEIHPRTSRSTRVRRDLLPLERIAGLLIVLRRVVEAKPRDWSEVEWAFDLRAFALCVEADGRSYALAAEDGVHLWPELETKTRWWSEWKVREAVSSAREVIERRLGEARSRKRRGDGGARRAA